MATEILFKIVRSELTSFTLLTALASLCSRDEALIEPPHAAYYSACRTISLQVKGLAERTANESELSALQQQVRDHIPPMVARLQKVCDRHPALRRSFFGRVYPDHMTQMLRLPLLQVGRDGFPHVFERGSTGKLLLDAEVESQLATVRLALIAIGL